MLKKFYLLIFVAAMTVACSKDDDNGGPAGCNSVAFSERFADEVTAINNASLAYSQNPTSANCETFKTAYLNYIDALEGYENCAIFLNQRQEWRQSLDAARTSAMGIVC